MLQEIRDILVAIGEFFTTVIDFVIAFFKDLVYMVTLVGETTSQLPQYLDWLPEGIVGGLLAIFAIVIIYKILGREG